MAAKEYILEMEVARGLGIVLVTIGHSEPIKDTFPQIFDFIYSFHMPLFFFMSGFFSGSGSTILSLWGEYKRVFRRILYLIVPYIMISLTYTFIKLGMPDLVKRKIVLESLFANIFLYPTMNPALFLWFLYIIILMKLLTPVLSRINHYIVFLLLLLNQIFPIQIELFGTGLMVQYLIYYFLGLKTFEVSEACQLLLRRRQIMAGSFVLFILTYLLSKGSGIAVMKFFTAILGSLWILSTCYSLIDSLPVRWLKRCGRYSLQIYLLQYYFIFPLQFLLSRMGLDAGLIVMADFVIGLVGPLFLVTYLFRFVPALGFLFGGMKGLNRGS